MPAAATLEGHREQDLRSFLGPVLLRLLRDDDVQEVMLNPDGGVWVIRHSTGLQNTGDLLEPSRAEALLTTIAGMVGEELTRDRPTLECELPFDGSRLAAVLPPLAPAPTFTIRKHAKTIYRLEDYFAGCALTESELAVLRSAIRPQPGRSSALNVLIAGGPASGKTTLANALLAELADPDVAPVRVVLVEDTYELQCEAPCKATFRTNETHDLGRMVKLALRHRPERLIVGEVRGAEALDLLDGWEARTGGGIATVHANGAVDALHRLDHLAQEAGTPSVRWRVANTIHLVVFIERLTGGRKVTELIRVHGLAEDGSYLTSDLMENAG